MSRGARPAASRLAASRFAASRAAAPSALACGLVLLSACNESAQRTQVMLSVSADARVREMSGSLVVEVWGRSLDETGFSNASEDVTFRAASDADWPRLVALSPRNGDAERLYRADATAFSRPAGAGNVVASTRVLSGYVAGRVLLLEVQLAGNCMGVDCPNPVQTCRDGACAAATIDPASLPDYEPNAGQNKGLDAGTADAGAAGCSFAADCPEQAACATLSCENGECVYAPNHGDCNDGIRCTEDRCDAVNGCIHLPNDSSCNDAVGCTDDVCDVSGGGCTNRPDDQRCTAGPGGTCEPASGGCQYAVCTSSTCRVEDSCTQSAVCSGTQCVYTPTCGTGPCCGGTCTDCDDSNDCTLDRCDGNACTHTEIGGSCDDRDACTINDSCSAGDCLGQLRNCDDGKECTLDGCISDSGCTNNPDPLHGEPCDGGCPGGGGICNSGTCVCEGGSGGCPPGPNPCDDQFACTRDLCIDTGGAFECQHEVDPAYRCDDFVPCTQDVCDPLHPNAEPGTGCVHNPQGCPPPPDGGIGPPPPPPPM